MKTKRTATRGKKRVKTTRQVSFSRKLSAFFSGRGGIFVVLILALTITGAVALTGGVMPKISNTAQSGQVGNVATGSAVTNQKTLQLTDLKFQAGTPTPTPTPVACLNKIALNLVLDVSTSMNDAGKIGQLNNAMKSLVGQLQNETVVAATEFAGLASFPTDGTKILLTPTRNDTSSNQTAITNALTTLSVQTDSANDGTYMRNAFSTAMKNLTAEKNAYAAQGYKFITILFTDGVPETQYTDHNCEVEFPNPYLCFSKVQDPRTDLTTTMKQSSDKVYSVGIYSGARELQAYTQAKQLLADIASAPSYETDTKDPTALTSLFGNILSSVCN